LGYEAIGMEKDPTYFALAEKAIEPLAALYPGFDGSILEASPTNGSREELSEQLLLLDAHAHYVTKASLRRKAKA